MTIRTLHINEQRGWRGGEQQVAYLVDALAQQGHATFLACRNGSAFLEEGRISSEVETVVLPFRNELDLATAWNLAKLVKRHDIDIIHAHTAHAHSMACLARRFAGRGKVLVARRVANAPRNDWLNRFKYNWPDGYVTISRKIAEVMDNFGIPEDKLSVVYSAIDASRFGVEPLPRDALPLPAVGPLLGNVAALSDEKDHRTLLWAMPGVLEDIPDAQLVIAGEGPMRGTLEAMIAELDLTEHVHLLGYRKDIPALLNALDVFIMSSKQEGLCTSILDAMAAGASVVATAGGGIPEIVLHEKTGLLAPVGDHEVLRDHIVRLLKDQSLRESLNREAAIMLRDKFTVDQMVAGNLAVYERLVST